MTFLRKLVRKLRAVYSETDEKARWRKWLRSEAEERARNRAEASRRIDSFIEKPLISVIIPVYNIEETFLRKCLGSVLNQWYPHFEVCIADDKSPAAHIRKVLTEFAERDPRVKLSFRDLNGGISAASNTALDLAEGDFCALLDHDDELEEDALFWIAEEISRTPDADILFSDEDKIDGSGRRYDPAFKPDWSRDLFYSLNMLNHLTVYRTQALRAAGGFRAGFEGSQDYDAALRVLELIPEENIKHIPRILYHWRALPGSVALASSEKSYAHERARAALAEHFERTGVSAAVEPTVNNWHRVKYSLDGSETGASVFVYGSDHSTVAASAERLLRLPHNGDVEFNRVVCPPAHLAAALNKAAEGSKARVLCFLAAGLYPAAEGWLDELRSFALQEAIGAVGAKILGPRGDVAGGGLILGVGTGVETAHYSLPRGHGGNLGRNLVISNYSAVSISCMATHRRHFKAAAGFDSENFASALFDADYCLRLRELGLRIVHTPYAELIESKNIVRQNRPSANETGSFRRKWKEHSENDPFYNVNLSNTDGRFRIRS